MFEKSNNVLNVINFIEISQYVLFNLVLRNSKESRCGR
jgi:hypothetical protein